MEFTSGQSFPGNSILPTATFLSDHRSPQSIIIPIQTASPLAALVRTAFPSELPSPENTQHRSPQYSIPLGTVFLSQLHLLWTVSPLEVFQEQRFPSGLQSQKSVPLKMSSLSTQLPPQDLQFHSDIHSPQSSIPPQDCTSVRTIFPSEQGSPISVL